MPTHKWRQRPPHLCGNPACGRLHTSPGPDCPRCSKRLERRGTYEIPERTRSICKTPACRSFVKAFGHCIRCHRLWLQDINPDTYLRPYRRLCSVSWCPEYSQADGMCKTHVVRFRKYDDVRRARGGIIEPIPVTCTHPGCEERIWFRGLCLEHLMQKSSEVILLREFWPKLPGHRKRYCIGKPGCKRNAILFGRCPDCLYDWQFSLKPRRNFFKIAA